MVPPLLKDWSEFDRLRFDAGASLVAALSAATGGRSSTRGRGKWGISHFILIDALNFVFELVGATQTYLSLDESPEMVRRAIDFAFDLNVRVQETFFEAVPALEGGTLSNFAQWLPGRIVSESLDPFHMTSVAYFERWGREPAERIMGHFDGGVIHIHGNGRHLLEAAATLRGLKAILLLDDVGFPPAFDVRGAIEGPRGRRAGQPLSPPTRRFVERLGRHDLPGGVLYQVQNVPGVDAANRLMEQVRAYRA